MSFSAEKIAYLRRIEPLAKSAAAQTGIPAELIAAWWTWETAFGTNNTHKVHNHAGIGSNSSGRDFVAYGHAAYNSPENFVRDYVRTISLKDSWRGYTRIIEAARKNPSDYATITRMHNESKWSVADYNVGEIVRRATAIRELYGTGGGGGTPGEASAVTCPACGVSLRLGLSPQ